MLITSVPKLIAVITLAIYFASPANAYQDDELVARATSTTPGAGGGKRGYHGHYRLSKREVEDLYEELQARYLLAAGD